MTPIQPKGEPLRKAVRWLSETGRHTPQAVEEAARRFDLSPAEEAFLLDHFRNTDGPNRKGESGSRTRNRG